MTTRAGLSEYAVAISTTTSTDGLSPLGDIIYIATNEVQPKWKLDSKIIYTPGRQSFSVRDAKKHWSVNISSAYFKADVTSTPMDELNAITKYIEDWTDLSHAPVYLFIANGGLDGTYVNMKFRDNTGTDRGHLGGFPVSFDPKLKGKITYVEAGIGFNECWS